MKTQFENLCKSVTLMVSFAIAAAGAGIGTVQAQESASDSAQPSLPVHYGDLDLDSMQGAKILLARLRQAASRVCQPQFNRNIADSGWQACYDNAMAVAVRQINKSMVTQAYRQQLGLEAGRIG